MSSIPYRNLAEVPVAVRPVQPVLVPAPRRRINPLIPLLCIGVILFLIAATIIIALIPLYVEKNLNPVPIESIQYTALYRINNGTLPVGNLTVENCAVIEDDQQDFASASGQISPNTPDLIRCYVTMNTSVTRRRRQSQSPEANLIVLNGRLEGTRYCRRGDCLVTRANKLVNLLLNRGVFYLTLTGANGTRFVFSITCISASAVPSESAARANDIAILNYALILEQLEASFYNRFQESFTAQDFIAANFTQQNYDYLNIIYVHELAHVRALRAIITQLGGTPVPECSYDFSMVTDVRSYLQTARILENTGTMAYDGAANGIADTTLRQIAATVATVEGRHSSYLNSIQGLIPFPSVFENATAPSVVIQAISPFISSCPFTITAPTVPYVGAVSFSGTVPTSNSSTSALSYTNLMYVNDLRVLNFALVAEQLEANYYNRFVSRFTGADFIAAGFPDVSALFIIIREHENAHVQFLRMTITQRSGTPVSECSYNFNVTNVRDFVRTSRLFENTGVKAYNGAINRITDPNLIMSAATIATVEARYAAFLNNLENEIPFPNTTDPTLTPEEVVVALSPYQVCPFTPELPIILNPSSFVPNI